MFSWEIYEIFGSSHRRCFMKKAVLKNFSIFAGKLQACNFIKNRCTGAFLWILRNFSTLFVIFIFVFENSQNLFSCGPRFGPFWSVRYLNFGQKLLIRTTHYTFLESKHPEVTKNPFYILFPEGNQKTVLAHRP